MLDAKVRKGKKTILRLIYSAVTSILVLSNIRVVCSIAHVLVNTCLPIGLIHKSRSCLSVN